MERSYKFLPLFFVLILVLAPIGFRNYLGRLVIAEKQHGYVHFHAMVMTLWCGLLIVQPLLILQKKRMAHQIIGKCAYGLVPILVLSMLMMLYHGLISNGKLDLTPESIQRLFFPFTQILIFALFYAMAMKHIRRPALHMRYIIVSSVSLLGPTIGRINFEALGLPSLNWDLWIMEGVLVCFFLWDTSKSKKGRPYLLGLTAFGLVHLLLTLGFEASSVWEIVGLYLAQGLIHIF